MRKRNLSSGDLIADRRAAYAEALAEDGDFAAAADLIEQALELVPDWTGGLSLLGDYRERAGDIEAAKAAWRQLADRDQEGIFGAVLKLAAYGMTSDVRTTDTAFVAALFDDYADRFESQLLLKLRYAVPETLGSIVVTELARRGTAQVARAIDLGCGTGLMGERLRHYVSYLEGVDLSQGMIEESRRKGIYDVLTTAELSAFLAAHEVGVDLLTASDVFNYCGDLGPVIAASARVLSPGGLLAFSLEAYDGPEPMILRPSLRYAHEHDAALGALRGAGFDVIRFERSVLRFDRGEPVAGFLVLAAKAAVVVAPIAAPDDEAIHLGAPLLN